MTSARVRASPGRGRERAHPVQEQQPGAWCWSMCLGPGATFLLLLANTVPFALFILFVWEHEWALVGYFLPVVILHQASTLIIASRWYSAVFFDWSLSIVGLFWRFPGSAVVVFLPWCIVLSYVLLMLVVSLLSFVVHGGVSAWTWP